MSEKVHGPQPPKEAYRVGSRHSHIATPMQQAPGSQRTCGGSNHHEASELTAIMAVASCFARRGKARWVRQSRTMGPKRGCDSSH